MTIKSVLVTELHPRATEQDVLDMFIYCGPVEKIEMKRSRTTTVTTPVTTNSQQTQETLPSASCVIQYCDPKAAQMALFLSRAIILGKAVQVAEYHDPQEENLKKEEEATQKPPRVNSSPLPPRSRSSSAAPALTRQSSSQQLTAKTNSRASTPTFSSLFSNTSSNSSSAPLFSIFSSSPPKHPQSIELQPMRSTTPTFSSVFSSSPPKMVDLPPPLPPKSAPIPIKRPPSSAPSPVPFSTSPASHSSFSSAHSTPSPSPSPQGTPPIVGLHDKNHLQHAASKPKSTADDLEEMLHISEKVDKVNAIATELAHKATIEGKKFDEKYNLTSKFNMLKAKALSFKNEVSEKMQN